MRVEDAAAVGVVDVVGGGGRPVLGVLQLVARPVHCHLLDKMVFNDDDET